MRKLYQDNRDSIADILKQRLIRWRREPATVRVTHATRIDRARALGYKAKQGFIIVRQRVKRGGHRRPTIKKGRAPRKSRQKMVLDKNYQQVAEERVNRKYPNCEVLNSYLVMKDGIYAWYEVILIDRAHPNIKKDPQLRNIAKKRGRTYRGLTSAGRKARGLRRKGKGAEKVRPSRNATFKRKISKPKKYKPII